MVETPPRNNTLYTIPDDPEQSIYRWIVVTAVASHDLLLRVELGLVAGSLTAMVTFAYALHVKLRDGAQTDAASFIDALTDHPLETP